MLESFPCLFLQMELASPCRISVAPEMASFIWPQAAGEWLSQWGFAVSPLPCSPGSSPACLAFTGFSLQPQAIVSCLPSPCGAPSSVTTREFVWQAIGVVVQSRFLEQNLFPRALREALSWVSHHVQVTCSPSPYYP